MSGLKKLLLSLAVILLLVVGWIFYQRHQESVQLAEAFKKDDRIVILYHLMFSERYADEIRQAGYIIPSDGAIRLDDAIDPLELEGELHIKVIPPGEHSDEFRVLFSTMIDGKTTDVLYNLDKNLNLVRSDYSQVNEENITEDVSIPASEEERLLRIVKTEIQSFLDTMYQTFYE